MIENSTKENILNSSTKLFLKKGYNASGLQEILTAANVPKGSFYHFFKSKEMLGKEVLAHYSDENKPIIKRYLVDYKATPLSRLEAFFDEITRHYEQDAECSGGCLIGNLAQEMSETNESFRILIETIFSDWKLYFTTCLKEAQQAHEISQDIDTEELAEVMLNSWEGALLKMKVTKSVAPLRGFKKIFFSLLTNQ